MKPHNTIAVTGLMWFAIAFAAGVYSIVYRNPQTFAPDQTNLNAAIVSVGFAVATGLGMIGWAIAVRGQGKE